MIDFSYVKTDYSKRLEDIRQAHMIEHMDRQAEVAEAIPEVEELQKQISASSVALIEKTGRCYPLSRGEESPKTGPVSGKQKTAG